MEITIKGTAKEIAALAAEIQERHGSQKAALVRRPYERRYSIVNTGSGRDGSFDAK